MPLMNFFPQLARNLLMRSRRQLAGDKSCLEYLNITDQRFCFTPENSSQVFSQQNKIKLSKSKETGLDKISAKLIHECADLICISICQIFNCSLTTGIFPDNWKCVKVTSLFKQGSSSDMNSYRPISVISVVAKVFEIITYNQVEQPHFDFCNVVWGSCGIKLADKLQKLQNRAARGSNFPKL